jgi:hypothetical protein
LAAIARVTGLDRDLFTTFSSVTREGVAEVWARIEAATSAA